jgi:non-ribosomal peptide synthetase component F
MARIPLDGALKKELAAFCQSQNVTQERVFTTSLALMLGRLLNPKEVCFALNPDRRFDRHFSEIPGPMQNILLMRVKLDDETGFAELVRRMDADFKTIHQKNGRYPFDLLEADLARDAKMDLASLHDVMFSLHPEHEPGGPIRERIPSGHLPRGLNFMLWNTGRGGGPQELLVEYQKARFSLADAVRLGGYLLNITRAGLADPQAKASGIRMLQDDERGQLLEGFNRLHTQPRTRDTFIAMFEKQAQASPQAEALWHQGRAMSYGELNRAANRLAHMLRVKGIKPDDIVGIMCEVSLYMIVGVLGILKAGAGYMPMDVRYPTSRTSYMLQN